MTMAFQLRWDGRRWLYATGVLLLIMLSATLRGRGGDTDVEQAIARHQQQTVRDTVRIDHAVAAAEQASRHEQDLVIRARSEQAAARARGKRADSLRRAVDDARATHDSVVAWENAYDARALEVLAVEKVSASRDTALVWANLRADSLHVALTVSETRAERADSFIRLAVRGCRVAGLLPCPRRIDVAIAAAAATAVFFVSRRE
jgi:hypothetical protein